MQKSAKKNPCWRRVRNFSNQISYEQKNTIKHRGADENPGAQTEREHKKITQNPFKKHLLETTGVQAQKVWAADDAITHLP